MVDQPYMQPTNPLAEASATSLDELMARNPETLDDASIDRIVAALREQRAAWGRAEAAGKKSAPKAGGAPAKTVDKELDLDNLGL